MVKLYKPIMFLEYSLTEIDAQCYTLFTTYDEILKHDNRDFYLVYGEILPHLFKVCLRKLVDRGVLEFTSEEGILELSQGDSTKPFNLSRDFKKYGEFNPDKLLHFCDKQKLFFIPLDEKEIECYPEHLLDLGEFLEEDVSFEIGGQLQVFKSLSDGLGSFQYSVENAMTVFKVIEKTHHALELLESSVILDRFHTYFKLLLTGSFGLTAYTIKDLGVISTDSLRSKAQNLKSKILDNFMEGYSGFSMFNIWAELSPTAHNVYQVLEVHLEHEYWAEDTNWIQWDLFDRNLGDFKNSKYNSSIILDTKKFKVEITKTSPTSTKIEISATYRLN